MPEISLAEAIATSATALIVVCFAVAGVLTLVHRPATERELDRSIVAGAVLVVAGPFTASVTKWVAGLGASASPAGLGRDVRVTILQELAVTGGVLALTASAVAALGVALHRHHAQLRRQLPAQPAADPAASSTSPAPWAA